MNRTSAPYHKYFEKPVKLSWGDLIKEYCAPYEFYFILDLTNVSASIVYGQSALTSAIVRLDGVGVT